MVVMEEDRAGESFLETLMRVVEFLEGVGVAAPVGVEGARSGAERSVEVSEGRCLGQAEELEVVGAGTSHACSLFLICLR
jgi:hypothetical protein